MPRFPLVEYFNSILVLADADPLRESWRGFRAGKRQSLEPLGYENGLSGTKFVRRQSQGPSGCRVFEIHKI